MLLLVYHYKAAGFLYGGKGKLCKYFTISNIGYALTMFVLVYTLRHFIVPQVIMFTLSLPGVITTNVVNVDIPGDLIVGLIALFARFFVKGIMEYITETLESEKLPMTCSMMSGQGPDGGEDSDSGTRYTEEKGKGKGIARPEDSSGSDSGTRNTAEKKR